MMLKYATGTTTALVTEQKKLEVAKSASAIGLLYEWELRSSVEQWQVALVANGHDWQTIADLIGKKYLGKTTKICEPTMRTNWTHLSLWLTDFSNLISVLRRLTVEPIPSHARPPIHPRVHESN